MISLLDGFLGYNQISVVEGDKYKTTFTTLWGNFSYNHMPIGLINVGATFLQEMNLSCSHLKNKIIIIYLDDLIIFSKRRKKHLRYMKSILQRCREHKISLNLKKSIFCVIEGKLLGHLVSKEGITVDLERVRVVQ